MFVVLNFRHVILKIRANENLNLRSSFTYFNILPIKNVQLQKKKNPSQSCHANLFCKSID